MTLSTSPEATIRPTFVPDSGEPIVVRPGRDRGDQSGLMLFTTSCTQAECDCLDTEIAVVPLLENDVPGDRDGAAKLMFDPIEPQLTLEADPGGLVSAETLAWFEQQLLDGTLGDLVGSRAERLKFKNEPRPWRKRTWDNHHPGSMVPFAEAVPGEFDLFVDVDDRGVWVADQYCVNPDCPCTDVVLCGYIDGKFWAQLRVDLDDERVVEGAGRVDDLWDAFRDEHGVDVLQRRRERMREMAADIGHRLGIQTPVRVPPKIGRNDRCPCGSGKKFKKCCM